MKKDKLAQDIFSGKIKLNETDGVDKSEKLTKESNLRDLREISKALDKVIK